MYYRFEEKKSSQLFQVRKIPTKVHRQEIKKAEGLNAEKKTSISVPLTDTVHNLKKKNGRCKKLLMQLYFFFFFFFSETLKFF